MYKLVVSIFILIINFNFSVGARFAAHEDAEAEIEMYSGDINIKKDGSSTEIIECQTKILNNSGIESRSFFRTSYNEYSTKFTILEAKTITDGQVFEVPANMIEDKPLGFFAQGFDQYRQLVVAFPNVKVGSKIYMKYKIDQFEPDLKNFFSSNRFWGYATYVKNSHVKIQSELPLYSHINNPTKALNVVENKKDGLHNIIITQQKPIYTHIVNENSNSYLNLKHLTWISLSSLNNWNDLAKKISNKYEKVLDQELPKEFLNILNTALTKTTEIDQINTVTSLLNDTIRYLGDWRTVKGAYFPNDLAKIAKTNSGDCKDFTVSAGSILKKMGYEVYPTLTYRGFGFRELQNNIPVLSQFNHAILKVVGKTGKIYWIDATNIASMAQGIFPDIANKMSLVLDSKNPIYERIPNVNYDQAKSDKDEEFIIDSSKKEALVKTHVRLEQEMAADFTGIGLYRSKKDIEDLLFHEVSGSYLEDKDKKSSNIPPLKSRIVENFDVTCEHISRTSLLDTNLGLAFSMKPFGLSKVFENITNNQVGDLFLGMPRTMTYKTSFSNKQIANIKFLDCSIDSPWIQINRFTKNTPKGTEVFETIKILDGFILNEDFKTMQFINLSKKLRENFKRIDLIFSE